MTATARRAKRHGTRYSYVMGCRCVRCKRAARDYQQKYYIDLKN